MRPILRWALVWLVLVAAYLAARLAAPLLLDGEWSWTGEAWAHLAVVPAAQTAALAGLAALRRGARRS